jgi:predicted lipoprotein with Yx(FWY)xxD motif
MTAHRKARAVRRPALLAAALAVLLGALAVAPSIAAAAPLVGTARNAKLHKTILVDRRGHTLYDLSAERHGRFICTNSFCLGFWTPLVVPAGKRPTGSVGSLSTIRRPDGKRQVTYKGRPLYTFNDDAKRGDAKGEGFRDVGVWHAVAVQH